MAQADGDVEDAVGGRPAEALAFHGEEHGALADGEVLHLAPVPVVRRAREVLVVGQVAAVGRVDFLDDQDALPAGGGFPVDVAGAVLVGDSREVIGDGAGGEMHIGDGWLGGRWYAARCMLVLLTFLDASLLQ